MVTSLLLNSYYKNEDLSEEIYQSLPIAGQEKYIYLLGNVVCPEMKLFLHS
jgi:hypothetical protein